MYTRAVLQGHTNPTGVVTYSIPTLVWDVGWARREAEQGA